MLSFFNKTYQNIFFKANCCGVPHFRSALLPASSIFSEKYLRMKIILSHKTPQDKTVCVHGSFHIIMTTAIYVNSFFFPQRNDKNNSFLYSKKKKKKSISQGQTFLQAEDGIQTRFSFVFNTQTNFFFKKRILDEEEMKVYSKISNLFPVCCHFVSRKTPCLLTWQHVMLCQVLSPKKTR